MLTLDSACLLGRRHVAKAEMLKTIVITLKLGTTISGRVTLHSL